MKVFLEELSHESAPEDGEEVDSIPGLEDSALLEGSAQVGKSWF